MGKLSSMAGGQMVTKWWDRWLIWVRMLLQSWDQVVFCQGVNPQVHEAHCAGEHVDVHDTWNGVLEDPYCHYWDSLTHKTLHDLLQGHQWPSTGCFPSQASHNLHEPWQRAWRFVFWHGQLHHHFSGWNSRFISLLGDSGSISAVGCH